MSAQPTDQIGGSPPKSSLFRSLRGSFSQGGTGVIAPAQQPVIPAQPADPVPVVPAVPPPTTPSVTPDPLRPPVPTPTPVPEVPEAPVELEQVAQEVQEVQEVQQPQETQEVVEQPETSEPVLTVTELPAEEPLPESLPAEEPVLTDAVAAAVPMAVDSMTDTLNPPSAGGGTAKEAPLLSVTVEHPAVDQAGGVQYVEAERNHEMPPEVEGFIQKVEDNVDQIPQEIVISDVQSGQQLPRVLATPVVVLPITPAVEDTGKHKPSTYSIRWLIEWSWKMMKVFSGKVVYREDEGSSSS